MDYGSAISKIMPGTFVPDLGAATKLDETPNVGPIPGGAGATATLTFTGVSVSVIGARGPGLGTASIKIDRKSKGTVSETGAARTRVRLDRIFFAAPGTWKLRSLAPVGKGEQQISADVGLNETTVAIA